MAILILIALSLILLVVLIGLIASRSRLPNSLQTHGQLKVGSAGVNEKGKRAGRLCAPMPSPIHDRMNPANPLSPLNLSNPANPSSPLNPMNPANPNSPLNPMNPRNPASPLNPNNPANPASPLN